MDLDFQYLFTAFEGRINRAKWWAGIIIIAIISIVLGFIVGAVFGPSFLGTLLLIIVTLVLFYPSYAVSAKRFQDRDKPGMTALYGLVPVLIASLLQTFGLTGTTRLVAPEGEISIAQAIAYNVQAQYCNHNQQTRENDEVRPLFEK